MATHAPDAAATVADESAVTTGPEIAYCQQKIEQYGQPALDAGCGTGRLLIPFLRAGLDVDGCDVSGDMLVYCQQAADRAGVSPRLYQQALHQLALPRPYQTINAPVAGKSRLYGCRRQRRLDGCRRNRRP